MKIEQPAQLNWFKSSYSSGEGGACVEIAVEDAMIHIRDSKNRDGSRLAFAYDAWTDFIAGAGRSRSN